MITRRQAFAAGALIAVRPATALAASNDRGPLSGLVAYQQEALFGYQVVLRQGPFTARDRATFERFRNDAEQASAALRKALRDLGGKPSPPPDPSTAPPPSDPSRRGYLADLITAEELAAGAYYAALQNLEDERHLRGCAAFMAQAGRHLVVLRQLAGRPLLPRAFETGAA
jgi:ferric-dicitrate binding protein FerR (iron transport regulator)